MRILIYGDSNTWGYDPKDGSRQSGRYVNILKQRYPEHEFIECGLCGRTLCFDDPFDEDRNGTKSISMVIKSHMPLDKVIFLLGTNDAKRQFSSNVISLEKGIKSLLYKALNPENYRMWKYPVPEFIVICPPKMYPEYQAIDRTFAQFGDQGYHMLENSYPYLKKGCDSFDVHVIEHDIVASDIDAIHLDAKGHQQIADLIGEIL